MNTTTTFQRLIEGWVRSRGVRKCAQPIDFPPGEIATNITNVEIPVEGKLLRVPTYTCAILLLPSGRITGYPQGDHYLNLPPGKYTMQYVDMRPKRTHLAEVQGVTQDAWDVSIKIEILWRVIRPASVLGMAGFINYVGTAFQAAVIDYIRSLKHDQLIPVPGGQAIEANHIVKSLLSSLYANDSFRGVQILNVLLLDRRGDRRRTEVVQKAVVEKTVIQEQNSVEVQRLKLATGKLANEKELLEGQQELELKKTQIERLKAEEEEKVRLRKAEIAAHEAKLLRESQFQEVEIKQQAESQRIQHEQILKSLEVRGQAIGQLVAAIMQTQAGSGVLRPLDEDSRETLIHALEALAKFPSAQLSLPTPISTISQTPTLREYLSTELVRILSLPGARCDALKSFEDGSIQATIYYLNSCITVVCGHSYPSVPPLQVMLYNNGSTPKKVAVNWTDKMTLQDIVLEAVNQGASDSEVHNSGLGGNGAKRPKSVAA